jgi:hypothetical protein
MREIYERNSALGGKQELFKETHKRDLYKCKRDLYKGKRDLGEKQVLFIPVLIQHAVIDTKPS